MPRKVSFVPLPAAVFLIVVAGVVICFYVFFPIFLERAASAQLREQFGLEKRPRVDLRGEPPPSLPGSFSGGRIEMEGAEFAGVRTGETIIDLDAFDLDLAGSVVAGAPRSEEPISGSLSAILSEAEVSRLVREEAEVPVRGVQLEEGDVVVWSVTRVLGLEVPVSARGDIFLRGGKLVYEPRRLSASGVPLPEEIIKALLSQTSFAFRLGELPYGAEITRVEAREGRLVLGGEIEEIPLQGAARG